MADKIVSRPATDKYREEYDRIFGKKPKNGPQYGVVQSFSRLSKPDTGPVASDLTNPITEDGSEPSSK